MSFKKIKLMTGGFTIVDIDDYYKYKDYNWTKRGGNYAGRVFHMKGKQKTILLHREILNAKPGQLVDHINGDPLDNRKSNLRFCTRSKNAMNCKIHKHNTSGYKGVSRCGKKWRAYIVKNNKQKHIGIFKTKEEAAKAYNQEALRLFGEFAKINEVSE